MSKLKELRERFRGQSLTLQQLNLVYLVLNFSNFNSLFISRYMPAYLYSEELYPNYLSGYGYVMSIRIALSLYEEAFSVPIIHMEDVFLTGKYFLFEL